MVVSILLEVEQLRISDVTECAYKYLSLWNNLTDDTQSNADQLDFLYYFNLFFLLLSYRDHKIGHQLASIPLFIESVQESCQFEKSEFIASANLLLLQLLSIVQRINVPKAVSIVPPLNQNDVLEQVVYGLKLSFYLSSHPQNAVKVWKWCRNELSRSVLNPPSPATDLLSKTTLYCLQKLKMVKGSLLFQTIRQDDFCQELMTAIQGSSFDNCLASLQEMVLFID
jgi:hypothetical protein